MKRSSRMLLLMLMAGLLTAQSKATFGQMIGVIKKLKPEVSVIGVMGSSLSTKDIDGMTRNAMQQGLKLFVAIPGDARDVSSMYKVLVGEKKSQMIIIPSADDRLMNGMGFDVLKEFAMMDRVGICVQNPELVNEGAMCSVTKEADKISVAVNRKVLAVVNAAVPAEEQTSITFVLR